MKTIEEAARKHVDNLPNNPSFWDSFMEGVEFAYRWIPVSEELPKKQGHYLVIAPKSFPKNCEVMIAEFYEDNQTFYCEYSDFPLEDVTHWRPIEYK